MCLAFLNSYKQELDSYLLHIILHIIAHLVIPMAINIFLSNMFIQTSPKMGSTAHTEAQKEPLKDPETANPTPNLKVSGSGGSVVNSHIMTLVSWSNYVNLRTAVTAAQVAGKEIAWVATRAIKQDSNRAVLPYPIRMESLVRWKFLSFQKP